MRFAEKQEDCVPVASSNDLSVLSVCSTSNCYAHRSSSISNDPTMPRKTCARGCRLNVHAAGGSLSVIIDGPLECPLADPDVAVASRGGHRLLHRCLHGRASGVEAALAARQHQLVSTFGLVHRPDLRGEKVKSTPSRNHPRTCAFSTHVTVH